MVFLKCFPTLIPDKLIYDKFNYTYFFVNLEIEAFDLKTTK